MGLSPRQEQVTRRLRQQIGEGPAAFFREACGLLAERPLRRSVTHLVCHLLREVESAVRSVIEPPTAGAGAGSDRHRAKIEAVLTELGIPLGDPVAEYWLGLAGDDSPDGLARRAHRSALDAPRPPDAQFFDLVARVELVLDAVLERFETAYFEVYERLDVLLATTEPSREHAKSVRNRFPVSYAVSNYFFSRATASWIGPLKAEGFFRAPPPPQPDEDAGTVQLPPWPESQFLVRVASQAPLEVVDVAVGIPATENARVNYDLIKIAQACPPNAGARLVPQIVEAIGSRFGVLIPHEAGALLAPLCHGERVGEALELAQALLDRIPIDYGPASSVDVYEYAKILREHVPSLVPVARMPILTMLDLALVKAMNSDSGRHGARSGRDASLIWRPNIEGGDHRAETDARHALINAIRDTVTSLAQADPDLVTDIVAELESHDGTIFRRLALWLLAQHPEQDPGLVAARLIDPALIADPYVEREYLLLARSGASSLDAGNVRRLLRIIDAGPQPVPSEVAGKGAPEAATADAESRDRTARWQRNRLAAFEAALPPQWNARYQALVAEYGDAPDPTAAVPEPFAVWAGEASPLSTSDLAAMSTAALVEQLQTWQPPPSDWRVPSPSLRGALNSAIQADAERRSADLELFLGLPATYIGAVLNGLYQAGTNDAVLDWKGIVSLCEWINHQANDELADLDIGPGFREWREPRLDMLRLLMVGLNRQPNPVAAELDDRVWAVISDSCTDPDPDIDRENNAAGEGFGVMGLALNVARPQAVRAAISYGLRLRRRSADADLSSVLSVLDTRLDPALDPSKAVRCIFGELFTSLVWMAPAWATTHVDSVFPAEPDQQELLYAAWDAYLVGRITDAAWDLLADRYDMVVERLEPEDDDRVEESRAALFGRHLINRLWHGQLSLDSHNGLLQRYYGKVGPKVATYLMWSIGQSLDPTAPPERSVISRLTGLWDFRVTAVKNGADPRELAEFGRWFASGMFDLKWSFAQLLTALSLAGDIEADAAVLARTAELAAGHLQTSLTVLERWASLDRPSWRMTQCLDSIRVILRLGVQGSSTAVETSKKVISILALNHGIDLRDVLRDRPEHRP
jgi:hypothetical protein